MGPYHADSRIKLIVGNPLCVSGLQNAEVWLWSGFLYPVSWSSSTRVSYDQIFGPQFRHFSSKLSQLEDSNFALLKSSQNNIVAVFIYPSPPQIRRFHRKTFSRSLKKEHFGVLWLLTSIWGPFPRPSNIVPPRLLLGCRENRSKYGNMAVLQNLLLKKSIRIDICW